LTAITGPIGDVPIPVRGLGTTTVGVGACVVPDAPDTAFGLTSPLQPTKADAARAPTARAVATRKAFETPLFDSPVLMSLPCSWAIGQASRSRPAALSSGPGAD